MKKTAKSGPKLDFSYYQGTSAKDVLAGGVCLRRMVERTCPQGVLQRDMYFAEGGVFRCFRGGFKFTLENLDPLTIGEGEALVVYPDQVLTIEAVEKANLLVSVLYGGEGVADYFDRLGFFNGLHGPTSAQLELFRAVRHDLGMKGKADLSALTQRLSDMLVTYAHDLATGANAVVVAAIRLIRANLEKGIVRLTPLYEELHIGHTTLNAAFREAGIGSPAAFIRQEQFRRVKRLLTDTQKPIAEIARETGFISQTHFANFIKRAAGTTASALRRGAFIRPSA